jgi:hypothetical protein
MLRFDMIKFVSLMSIVPLATLGFSTWLHVRFGSLKGLRFVTDDFILVPLCFAPTLFSYFLAHWLRESSTMLVITMVTTCFLYQSIFAILSRAWQEHPNSLLLITGAYFGATLWFVTCLYALTDAFGWSWVL